MIIDAHTHAFVHWPYLPPVPDPAVRGSADLLVREMDAAGVARALVIASNNSSNPDNKTHVLSACRFHAGRLHPLLQVDTASDTALGVLDQASGWGRWPRHRASIGCRFAGRVRGPVVRTHGSAD